MSVERGVHVSDSQAGAAASGVRFTGSAGVDQQPHSHADGSTSPEVEVRVAAEPHQLSVLRAVVGDLAMRADFDVDSIADLRLAVDEACSSLIRLAAPHAILVCRFGIEPAELVVTAEVASRGTTAPRTDTFSWRVLTALTDNVTASVDKADSGHVVRIDLSKQRTVTG